MSSRRTFLSTTAAALAVPAVLSTGSIPVLAQTNHQTQPEKPTLPPLPYPYEALEPYIDAETMKLHHDKHHQGYVNGLIKAQDALEKARAQADYALIQHWSKQAAFHGGGHFLHSMFWQVMAPAGHGGGGNPSGTLEKAIVRSFGSVQAMKDQFSAAANAVEGSGWALLHYSRSNGQLLILQAENQHKLTQWNTIPLMGIDVWEHAYYLKYRNNKAAYVTNWWNIVNWAQVQKNYDDATKI
ncbi:MAG: superoxide dismutase [Chlorobi bacterium]|nr:MAG: superoxide dismutase [Bacteroidota bacterium]MBE2264812.1 superoxide dismutase [Flavobacteriales bacterium]MBL1160813.1 superoxide dismutase [Chlorobiota bacterium]MBW7852777.1 superoxide dismutase [Candidatus Kapabacteria bacterium]MCC6330984.1 superoxide dismutase [Ignavibacteria bacterium]